MSGEMVQRSSIDAGADGYLMKPFGLDDFLQKVRLHSRGNRRAQLESA